ncbi:MAG: hypothetical protein E7670_03755 [Ruminococcaceae bacterium]|nr:hypothetical protein [Oscillospiraceae bacterium]
MKDQYDSHLIYKREYLKNLDDIIDTIPPLNKVKFNKRHANHLLNAIKENEVLNALNEDDRERITNMFVLAVNISSLTGSILEIYVFKEERYAVVDISNDFLDLFSDAIVVLGSLLIQASEVAVHTYSDADFENYATLSLYFDFENDSSNVINTFKKMLKNTKNES